MKYVVIGFLLLILVSLGTALYALVKDRGQSTRTVRALTMRIALSIGLIVLLMVSYKAGLIKPHTSF